MATGEEIRKEGIDFIKEQHAVYVRQAWIYRWISWICGWGAAVLAVASGVLAKLSSGGDTGSVVATSLVTAGLAGIVQIVKPEVWADAYYRGHLLLEEAMGDYALGNASKESVMEAWHAAERGLPGAAKQPSQK